jgi:hypothetical protein
MVVAEAWCSPENLVLESREKGILESEGSVFCLVECL